MRPEWIIYKNEQRVGQALTWHQALDILVKSEGLSRYEVVHSVAEFISIKSSDKLYRIVKER